MAGQSTRIYENTTDKEVNVVGLGEIPAHSRISVTAEFHTPVNLENFPGVVDVLAYEDENGPVKDKIKSKGKDNG